MLWMLSLLPPLPSLSPLAIPTSRLQLPCCYSEELLCMGGMPTEPRPLRIKGPEPCPAMKQMKRNMFCSGKQLHWHLHEKEKAPFVIVMNNNKDNYCYHLSVLRQQFILVSISFQNSLELKIIVIKRDFTKDVKRKIKRKVGGVCVCGRASPLDISIPKQLSSLLSCRDI